MPFNLPIREELLLRAILASPLLGEGAAPPATAAQSLMLMLTP